MSQPQQNSHQKKSLNAREIASELEELVKAPKSVADERLRNWIRLGLHMISAANLEEAIKTNMPASGLLFQHFRLSHPLVAPLARVGFRMFWSSVEHYLTNARNLRDAIAGSDPTKTKLLDSEQGIAYLNRLCQQGYFDLYMWTWYPNVSQPRGS